MQNNAGYYKQGYKYGQGRPNVGRVEKYTEYNSARR